MYRVIRLSPTSKSIYLWYIMKLWKLVCLPIALDNVEFLFPEVAIHNIHDIYMKGACIGALYIPCNSEVFFL